MNERPGLEIRQGSDILAIIGLLAAFSIFYCNLPNTAILLDYWKLSTGQGENIIRYNSPCSLRVSVGELYKLDNRVAEIYTVWRKSFLKIVFFSVNVITSLIEVNFIGQ